MSGKKVNKVLVMVVGTIYNLFLLMAFFLLYLIIFSLVGRVVTYPDTVAVILLFAIMVLSFLSSLYVYRFSLKWAFKKLGYDDPFVEKKRWE